MFRVMYFVSICLPFFNHLKFWQYCIISFQTIHGHMLKETPTSHGEQNLDRTIYLASTDLF